MTLMMALLFMGGWLRSLSIGDGAVIQSTGLTDVLISANGRFRWLRHSGNFPTSDRITHLQWPVEQTVVHPFIDSKIEWQRRCGWHGFDIGEGHLIGLPLQACAIPYWSFTIPLTLFSGVLLLTKPTKLTRTSIIDPASAEEA